MTDRDRSFTPRFSHFVRPFQRYWQLLCLKYSVISDNKTTLMWKDTFLAVSNSLLLPETRLCVFCLFVSSLVWHSLGGATRTSWGKADMITANGRVIVRKFGTEMYRQLCPLSGSSKCPLATAALALKIGPFQQICPYVAVCPSAAGSVSGRHYCIR